MINEAAYVYYEGLAMAEGIDEIMKPGMAHPMGPLMLANLAALVTCGFALKKWTVKKGRLPGSTYERLLWSNFRDVEMKL